jgi:Mg-chelatase subunit ChlD
MVTQAQSPVSGSSFAIASPDNSMIKISGIDATAFPRIKANIFINKFCAMAGDLKKEDFKVKEDDIDVAIDDFYFTGNASGQKIDLAIVFDETTSMDAEINALKSKVKDLTQKINSSRLAARYSLVTFNGAAVATKINWTEDVDSFRNIIGKLSTSGGNSDLPENSLDGIERVLSFGFRPDAQKVIIVVTDEPSQQKGDGKSNSAYTMDDVKSDLLNQGAMLIAVSPDFRNHNVDPNVPRSDLPKYADMRKLANDASGLWIDTKAADFSTILKQILRILTGTYVIEYTSPDKAPAENRTFLVAVDKPGCVRGSDAGPYISPGSITSSQSMPSMPRRILELSISGRVFDDSNDDGVKGTDELGLEGWKIRLLDGPDGYSTTTITDQNGYYIFTGLLPGSYGLTVVSQSKWTATAPKEEVRTIELIDAHKSEIDFRFRISGFEV